MIEAQQVVSPLAAMKQALEAWQTHVYGSDIHHKAMLVAMTNMGQAIAEEEKHEVSQEPVAVVDVHEFYDNCANFSLLQKLPKGKHTLYTHPPQRTWVGLTDEERSQLVTLHHGWNEYGQAIEAKLKERNGQTL